MLAIQNLSLTPTKKVVTQLVILNIRVFGQVIKGMDVVDTIANLEVDDNSKPKENVTVNSVEVVKDYKFK